MERGGGRGRRGWRRGGDRTPQHNPPDGEAPRGGGGRRAGGGQRSRGWRGSARGGRGGPPPPERDRRADHDASEARDDGEEEEESRGYGFSRRKVVSNWTRYEDAEKEAPSESGETQRGTDYSVLLSSAGDSFAQFRFADEKEWEGEHSGQKQISALYVDCQSLVLALQALPLHLRVNVDAELVQEEIPLELPQMKPKASDDCATAAPKFGIPLYPVAKVPPGDMNKGEVVHTTALTRGGNLMDPPQALLGTTSLLQQEAVSLDRELDLLLHLDAPVNEEPATPAPKPLLDNPVSEGALQMDYGHREDVPPHGEGIEDQSVVVSSEQQPTTPRVTEEDLEDWLDSMIS